MKKSLVIMISLSLVLCFFSAVNAGWVLYDNFDSGSINTEKWHVNDSSADISIENGEAKFVHKQGYARVSSWLEIIDNPENIRGIRTKIRIESCSGDVRGRAGGWIGKIGENLVWSWIGTKADKGRVETHIVLLTPAPDYSTLYDVFSGNFLSDGGKTIDIIGKTFILEWMFRPDKVEFKADEVAKSIVGYGEIVFSYPASVSPYEDYFKGIGTRSSEGDGPCVIYFDDVYVYRQAQSAAINTLLLD